MKKITLLILIAGSLLYLGCKKEDYGKKEDNIKQMILGDWYYQYYRISYFQDSKDLYDAPSNTTDLHNAPHYHFNDDYTCTYGTGKYTYSIKSNKSGDSLLVTINNTTAYQLVATVLLFIQNFRVRRNLSHRARPASLILLPEQ